MKYKRLTNQELKELEPEFINFLSSAQITAQDWVKLKETDMAKVNELIDVFCDMVFEKILKKVKLVEFRDQKTLNIYNCLDDKIELVGLRANEQSDIDFTKENAFANWNEHKTKSIEFVKSEKDYSMEREVEIFELLQNGCFVTDDRLFNALKQLTKN